MKLKKLVPILLVISLFTGCSYKTNYKSDFNNNSSLNKNYKINGNIENNIQQGFFRSIIHNRVVLRPLNIPCQSNSDRRNPITPELKF